MRPDTGARTSKSLDVKALRLPSLKPEHLRLVIVGALGLLLLWLGASLGVPGTPKETPGAGESLRLRDYETALAREVENLVSSIQGAGKVRAAVTLEEGPWTVFARNETRSKNSSSETSKDGETRETLTENETSQPVMGRGVAAGDVLVPEKVVAPKVLGCVVIAEGAVSSKVKADIYRAVQVLLDIPIYKIVVLPMGGGR